MDIVPYMSFEARMATKSASHFLHSLIADVEDRDYNSLLEEIGLPALPFRQMMERTSSVLVGQLPLAIIAGVERDWKVDTVTLVVPREAFVNVMNTLEGQFRKRCWTPFTPDRTSPVPGMTRSISLQQHNGSLLAFVVKRAPLNNPLVEVASPFGTGQMNALLHDGLLVAYPSLTIQKKRLRGVSEPPDGWFEQHGWQTLDDATEALYVAGSKKGFLQPTLHRFLGDEHTLMFGFDGSNAHAIRTKLYLRYRSIVGITRGDATQPSVHPFRGRCHWVRLHDAGNYATPLQSIDHWPDHVVDEWAVRRPLYLN